MAVMVQPIIGKLSGGGTDYEQLVNYLMLYDEGDERSEITGGWGIDGYRRIGYSLTQAAKNSKFIKCVCGGQGKANGIGTLNPIDTIGFANLCIYAKGTGSIEPHNLQVFCTVSKTISENTFFATYSKDEVGVKSISLKDMQDSRYIYFDSPNESARSAEVYNVFLTKADNYQKLCELASVTAPSTIEELLADTTSLATIFNSEEAVKFMVKQCTGDFLASVIADKTVLALLEESQYYTLVQANEHWAKFLAMVA